MMQVLMRPHRRGQVPEVESAMSLSSNLLSSASAHADRIALRLGEAATTYRELDEASARVAGLLRDRGIRPDDRVGVMLPNTPEFALVYYGVLRVGGVIVPMNPLLKAREVAYYLGDSGARLLFAWHGFAEEASAGAKQAEAEVVVIDPATFGELLASVPPSREVAERADDDTAVILYTSGTTGQPKGAELTQANLARNAEVVTELFQGDPGRTTRRPTRRAARLRRGAAAGRGTGRHARRPRHRRVPGAGRPGPRRHRLRRPHPGGGGRGRRRRLHPRRLPADAPAGHRRGRSDDTSAVIRHRLEVFTSTTSPLIDYYRDRGILLAVDADRPPEAVTAEILARLSDRSPIRGTT
jgi:hypothetical protein